MSKSDFFHKHLQVSWQIFETQISYLEGKSC